MKLLWTLRPVKTVILYNYNEINVLNCICSWIGQASYVIWNHASWDHEKKKYFLFNCVINVHAMTKMMLNKIQNQDFFYSVSCWLTHGEHTWRLTEFCFPESHHVCFGTTSSSGGSWRVIDKNELFPLGPVIVMLYKKIAETLVVLKIN